MDRMHVPSASGLQLTDICSIGVPSDIRIDPRVHGLPYTFGSSEGAQDYVALNLRGGNFNPSEHREIEWQTIRLTHPSFLPQLNERPYGLEAFNRRYRYHHSPLLPEKN